MRHHLLRNKLGRNTSHREALMRNMASALFRHERIETTVPKARALRPYAEKLITLAKRGDLHARRLAARHIHDHEILQKLFAELGERFRTRTGGYTRILKTGIRKGDNADMGLIELVDAKLRKATPAEGDTSAEKGEKPAKAEKAAKADKAPKAEKPAKAVKAKPAKKEKVEKAPKEAKAPKAKKKADEDKPAKKDKAEKAPKKAAAKKPK